MKIALEAGRELPLERKIRMYEAREAIIGRLARDLPVNIGLERFLNVVVSEIGRMMQADRCDLLRLEGERELAISHEWRRDDSIPSSLGTKIPIDAEKLGERFDLSKPIRISDTASAKDSTLRFFAKALETRSLLIVPISLNGKVLSLLGLHDTRGPREWLDGETEFLESIARQLAIGYQYTSLYVAQEQETKRTNALLEIANTLNSHSDFNEASAGVLDRAVGLVGADYGALGVLDKAGNRISLASFRPGEGVEPNLVLRMIEEHRGSIDVEMFPAVVDILREGKTVQLIDKQLPAPLRAIFNAQLGGKAA
ncbi:MAG: GAF domain-containing protein, partial [Acidobacteria bacterium]|nr:GAF domain-containing protein [Acidobacteriota bacterium]